MYQKKMLVDGTRYCTGDPIPFLGAAMKDKADPPRSAYTGKQVVVAHPKTLSAAQEGLFTKIVYAPVEYDDSTGAVKEFPLDSRKLGFYTRAPARGMCTRMIDTERFRSHLKHEFRHIDKDLAATAARLEGSKGGAAASAAATSSRLHTKFEVEAPDVKEGMATTMYDHVHGTSALVAAGVTPDWQKTSKDTWYAPKLVPHHLRRRLGPHTLASDEYGYGIDGIEVAPEHGKSAAWKKFYNAGHVEANLSKFG